MFLESGKLQWTKKERSFANFQAITTVTTFPNYTRIYYSIRSKGLYIMKPRISAVVVVVADVFFLLPSSSSSFITRQCANVNGPASPPSI